MTTTEIIPSLSYEVGGHDGHTILRIKGTYHRLAPVEIKEGEEGRKVMHGPMVAGPWATTFGLSSVITDYDRSAEIADEKRRTVEVETGSLISLSGVVYRVEVFRKEYIRLIRVEDEEIN